MIFFNDGIKVCIFGSYSAIVFCVASIFSNDPESSHSNASDNISFDLSIKCSNS